MPDTKNLISSLRTLSTSIAHTDISKSTLFQDAAAEIERLDKALYEEKEKTRRLMRELSPLKQYDREHREIVMLKTKAIASPMGPIHGKNAERWTTACALRKMYEKLETDGLIQCEIKEEDGFVTAEATLRVLEPRGELIPADPDWFSRNHIDPDSPLMTE